MSAYTFSSQQFRGPLDKLLELIEERKLSISLVSLANVTDDFMAYLEKIKQPESDAGSQAERTRLIADFIFIASRLVLIKSKALLPELALTPEEEGDIKDLEDRLKIYQEFRKAFKLLLAKYRSGAHAFGRPYFIHLAGQSALYPGNGLDAARMEEAIGKVFSTLESFVLERKTIKADIISIEEKIKEIAERLVHAVEESFRTLAHARPRSEIVVLFLALLHLAREQRISLEQEAGFSDIIIRKN